MKQAQKDFHKVYKKFTEEVKEDDFGRYLYKIEVSKNPALYGDFYKETKELTIEQLQNRSRLLTDTIIPENAYITRLKAHASLFAKNIQVKGEDNKEQIEPNSKKRKAGKISSDKPDSIYRESFVVSDEVTNPQKYKQIGAEMNKRYQEKMRKIVDEDIDPDSFSRKVSFDSNYVLQRQLHELQMIRSGAPFSVHSVEDGKLKMQEKRVIRDVPNASIEQRKGRLKITTLTPRRKTIKSI